MEISIAIVEDLDEVRNGLKNFITLSTDFLVVGAFKTGEEALEKLPGLGADIVIMDIQLPGMDGLEATALLKSDESTRAIPVIALTALAMKGDEARIRAAGCDGYVAKPLDYREFLATVATHLAAGAG